MLRMDKGELVRREVHRDDRRVELASPDCVSTAWVRRYGRAGEHVAQWRVSNVFHPKLTC